jgi:hypothetical protein
MMLDVCALVRRDHDDLDRALNEMVDPHTSPAELSNLLDVFRLAHAVHSAAESKVLEKMMTRIGGARTLGILAMQARVEHVAQRAAADSLGLVRPGSIAWYSQALELRVLVLDHASRAELARTTFEEQLPAEIHREMAGEYATQRMRVLATTSPIATAWRLEMRVVH